MAQETSTKQPSGAEAKESSAPPPLPGAPTPPNPDVPRAKAAPVGPPPIPAAAKPVKADLPPAAGKPKPAAAPGQSTPDVPPVANEDAGDPGPAQRRAAKRRPAGAARPAAANDDLPSIGGLIFALHQKPSRRPLTIAAIASLVWLLVGGGFAIAILVPEWASATKFTDILARPTMMIVAAAVVIPISLFWLLALVAWRAQELKLMSSAMTEVAIRLAEPDRMAEQQIASVGQAVRRQVSHMNDAVSRALGRASELEALVHNEVATLERSYLMNENRINDLLRKLSGEQLSLVNTSEKVSLSLKELGTEIPTLIDRLGDQQVKLARFIEDAGRNLVALESSIASNAGNLANTVGTHTAELRGVLTDQTQILQSAIQEGTQRIGSSMQEGTQRIDSSIQEGAAALTGTLTNHADTVATSLITHAEAMQGVFDNFSDGLNSALETRTEGLQAVLEEYTRALDQTLESRQQQLDGQLITRTKALDDAFSQRVALFDEAVLRSTIAIDSSVADKARALSTALEGHAKEIGQVLGRQAGELDEQIMHGVHAVRRASENVTRQSLKAIEGLAGQADLLKNVSENLVNQINGVTNRFDQQGQTILRAANALETANYRIDKTLQNRQQDLSETLDRLSGKAEDIDRVLRGYSTSLEGTFKEAETRALTVGDALARTTEERSRQAFSELERLQQRTTAETDRALADLRGRFSTVSREVGAEIGSLSQRVTDSSEEMRRQAQRTLAELESEHDRLKAQMERLPETTRVTAETMRSSLQDQLKALEQLSQLSTREGARADISPPLARLQAPREAEPPAAAALPRSSITSVTQRVASELAATRADAAPTWRPASRPPFRICRRLRPSSRSPNRSPYNARPSSRRPPGRQPAHAMAGRSAIFWPGRPRTRIPTAPLSPFPPLPAPSMPPRPPPSGRASAPASAASWCAASTPSMDVPPSTSCRSAIAPKPAFAKRSTAT